MGKSAQEVERAMGNCLDINGLLVLCGPGDQMGVTAYSTPLLAATTAFEECNFRGDGKHLCVLDLGCGDAGLLCTAAKFFGEKFAASAWKLTITPCWRPKKMRKSKTLIGVLR